MLTLPHRSFRLKQQSASKLHNSSVIGKLLNTIILQRLAVVFLTMLFIIMQSGCGGGSSSVSLNGRSLGGGGASLGDRPSSSDVDSLIAFVQKDGPDLLIKSANSAPTPGSVTQSSSGTDSVQATVSGSASSGFPENIDVTINGIKQNPNDYTVYDAQTLETEHATYHNGIYYSGGDNDNNPDTDTWLVGEIFTDWKGSGDTDYLVGGMWAVIPKDLIDSRLLSIGVFIDGSDKFNQGNLVSLSGTAKYVGDAYGIYADQQEAVYVGGTTNLTANFGDSSQLGTIDGSVSKVYYISNEQLVPGNPTLTFNPANIGSTNSGFFKGTTSMTFDNKAYSGQWGGQFYGNDGTKPSSVAGTFGGKAADDSASLLGIFSSYLQQ